MIVTRFRLLAALLLAVGPVFAQAPAAPAALPPAFPTGESTALGAQIAELLAGPEVARAQWGIAVTAMDGTPIYGLDEGKLFRPASNAKLFTTAAAMALLGPDATVTTTVTAVSLPDSRGTLHGDLVLHGAGDANLSGRRLPYESPAQRRARVDAEKAQGQSAAPDPLVVVDDLAAQVAAKGVKRITGRVIGDDTLWPNDPYGIGWGIDDMVWGYGAPVSALAVDDNQIELTVTPAQVGTTPLVSLSPDFHFPPPDRVDDVQTVRADEPAEIAIDRDDLQKDTLHVEGAVAAGKPDVENVAVLDPPKFAAYALRDRLRAHGVQSGAADARTSEVPWNSESFLATTRKPLELATRRPPALKTARPEGPACGLSASGCVVLASHTSVPLAEDVVLTLKVSQNLHAEMMLRRLGAAFGDAGTFVQGARVVRQFLLRAGLDGDDFVFYDGSGLSTHDLVTPRAAAQLLAFAAKQPWFAAWKAALPVGGVDGSLAERFKAPPLEGHVFAKTGTLGESRALSGYVDCASGRQVIFSILVDDHEPGSSADRVVMDKIVAAIAAAE